MKSFAHADQGQRSLADVEAALEDVVTVARAEREAVARFVLERGGLPRVSCCLSDLNQVFLHLIVNAAHAIEDRGTEGTITVRTRRLDAGPGDSRPSRIAVEVADNGVGMSPDTRERCLEPFFTTKGERGSGLGLAMVYGVVQRHNGDIEIDSALGKGTEVRLLLPVRGLGAAMSAPAAEPPRAVPLRLLVIDDDPMLLKSLRDALESDGHEVTVANGGQAGIDAFMSSHDAGKPFPVVITDLGMPHVDGSKVAASIKATVPETFVIMLTGWGRRLVVEGERPLGVDIVLSKPPKITELRTALSHRFN